jgi:hypothetical protein
MKNFYSNYVRLIFLILGMFLSTQIINAQVSGTVFRDFNANGVKDNVSSTFNEPFLSGIIVNAYNSAGQIIASFTSSGTTAPNYTIPATGSVYNGTLGSNTGFVASGTAVRIEFINIGLGDAAGFNGAGNGTNVQLLTTPSTTTNFAVASNDEYWNNGANANPTYLAVEVRRGPASATGYQAGEATIVQTTTATTGPNAPTSNSDLTTGTITNVATHQQTGSLFGMALQRNRRRAFAAAVLKRGVDLGPQGAGGIYIINNNGTNFVFGGGFTLQGVTPSNGGAPLDFGSVSRDYLIATNNNFMSNNGNFPGESRDNDAFGKATTMSYGDIEADPNSDRIFMVNLFQRRIIVFNAKDTSTVLNNATPATLAPLTTAFSIASLPGLPTATGAGNTIRPFAIKIHKGRGYLGVVSDGGATQLASDLRGYILEFDPNNIADGFTTVVTINFNTWPTAASAYWKPWAFTGAQAGFSVNTATVPTTYTGPRDYPMPVIAGIEFNEDGSMDIGIKDRWGDQGAFFEYFPLPFSVTGTNTGTSGNTVTSGPHSQTSINGDLLHVCRVGTSWVIEGTAGSCAQQGIVATVFPDDTNSYGFGYSYGNTGREWYADRSGDGGAENSIAGMTKIYGANKAFTTVYDPMIQGGTQGSSYWSTQGVQFNEVSTGVKTQIARLVAGNDGSMDKSNGMGDIEVLIAPPPIQIGNRIWFDANSNGIQDAGETTAGVATGTTVTLRSPGLDGIYGNADDQTWTTTTNAAGNYYFSSLTSADNRKPAGWDAVGNTLLPGFDYRVEVAIPTGNQVTRTNTAANSLDNIDNDATQSGTIAILTFNTSVTNHNFDIGFKPLASIGDRVYRDDDKDGIQDAGEPGVAGVTVTLYQNGADGIPGNADDVVIGTTVTDAYGNYLFDNLTASTSAATSYNVGFTLPANYQFTTQTNTQVTGTSDATNTTTTSGGSTAANGSDANINTGRTGSFWLAPGEAERGVDAGIVFNTPVATNSIGNRVWYDTDGAGDQDANEPGVAGVTVTLYAADGVTIVATTVTDVNGNYLFTGLLANTNYIVGVTPPAGTLFTTSGGTTPANDTDSDINANTASPTFGRTTIINTGAAGTATLTIDAGLIPQPTTRASLGDRVWYDNNRDGVQDPGEPGIAGVTVQLLAANGVTVLATTTTDAFGNYIFPNLLPGDYRVGFGAVAGMQRTTQNSTSGAIPDATDSDADVTSGVTTGYRLVAGEKNMSVDAGYYSTQPAANVGALGDKVWNDLDGDGIQDANEPGVAGVTVTLYNSAGTAIATTTTDVNGNYLFPNLTPGNYSVGFSNLPAGFGFTAQDRGGNDVVDSDANPATGRTAQVAVTGGVTNTTLDAGIRQGNNSGLGSLGDRVWYDLNNNGNQDAGELGAAGVTVNLYNDANNDGVISGAELTPVRTTTTNALGEYLFDGLNAGNYQVGFTLPIALSTYALSTTDAGATDAVDSDGNPKNTSVAGNTAGAQTSYTALISLAQGEDNLSVDLGLVPPSNTNTLGGTVWFDTDSDGLQAGNPARVPGVLVTLYNSAGVAIATTSTDENGDYLFVGLSNGDYSVGFTNYPAGYDVTLKEGTNTASGGSDPDRVSGRTTTVTLNGANRDDRTLDAGLVSPRAALGNYVWDDLDRDGIQDAGETPVAGVTVSLYFDANNDGLINGAEATTPVATAITDADGRYFFPNLTPGNYQVGFTTLPTGMEFTTQDNTTGPDGDGVNSNGVGGDSDVSPTTGRTGIINLSPNEVDLTVDAGIRVNLPATIGNRVWADLDTDGVQDAGEPGIAGVLVTLYNSSNQPIGSAITDGNGNWQITNVPTGTGYYVIFTPNLPSFDVTGTPGTNPAWTAQNVGANGTQGLDSGTESDTDSDVTSSGANAGRTGTFNIVPGNNFPNIDAGIINWPANNILPIQLVSFTAQPQNGTVQLNWVVATENNVANYEVEYSSNGVNYSSIGTRIATGSRTYSLIHSTPKQGINYYRLKVIDRDGKVSYSEVRKVNFGAAAGSVTIYPNPTSDVVNITVASGMINKAATITVIAMDGRVVASKQVAAVSQTEVIDVRKLSSGKYILRISTNDNEVINKQVEVIR